MRNCAPPSDVVPIYLRVKPADIAFIKFVVESYEGVGIVRTVDRSTAVIVVLVAPDFLSTARGMLDSLAGSVEMEQIAARPEVSEDWLLSEKACKF